jgi:hypothetical protein
MVFHGMKGAFSLDDQTADDLRTANLELLDQGIKIGGDSGFQQQFDAFHANFHSALAAFAGPHAGRNPILLFVSAYCGKDWLRFSRIRHCINCRSSTLASPSASTPKKCRRNAAKAALGSETS